MIKSGFIVAKNFYNKMEKSIYDFISKSHFVVYPWHLDLNFHVNNAVYLKYCNHARLQYLSSSGVLRFLIKRKINPVLLKNEVTYKKSLKLFETFQVETKLESVKKKEIIIKHLFKRDQVVVASCLSYAKLISKKSLDYTQVIEEFMYEKK